MEGVKLAIPTDVPLPKLMGSDVIVGARVCATETEARESDSVSQFSAHKIDDCSSIISHKGASESCSQIKKTETELYKATTLLRGPETEDSFWGLDQWISSSASISGSDGKTIQRKVGKAQRNGNGPSKKPRVLQMDNLLPLVEADDMKVESDKLGSHLVKCSNAEKSQATKQKNTINVRRGDRRNGKIPVKAKYDTFLLKAGLQSLSPGSGGSNAFGTHGLKPDVHDVTKLIDDISLDELLDGSYKCPNFGKDTGNKVANGNENILDSVLKACSILRFHGPQGKQTEENDIHTDKNIPLLSSPSNRSAATPAGGDENSHGVVSSKDRESLIKGTVAAADTTNDSHLYQPSDVFERLVLPPRDLESLLQDAVKPVMCVKLTDSRSAKPSPTRVSLPPFPWSHSFNGHHKSNTDAVKSSNRSTCHGRWVRIRSGASFSGGGTESSLDLDSLAYDHSLVPPGKLTYRLPKIDRSSSSTVTQNSSQQDLPSPVSATVHQPPQAVHSPPVLAAAQTLCDLATHCLKLNLNGILKWPKQPSLKAMKARKSRLGERPGEELLPPKSEPTHNYEVRVGDHGSSAKKPKLSGVERTQDLSHVQTVIGLSSVSAPRSSRPSPIKLSRASVSEARHSNGSFAKPPFTIPPPIRILDRSLHNPQKPRKAAPMDWNRSRS